MNRPKREFEYYVLRYVPDVVREEFVNVGVILREKDLRARKRTKLGVPFLGMVVLEGLTTVAGLDRKASWVC